MDQFPPNSRKAAQAPPREPKRVERVTSAQAEVRKTGVGRRFRETFFGEDTKTAIHYSFFSVAIPRARDMLFDVLQSGLERRIYGERRVNTGQQTNYANIARVNYQSQGGAGPAAMRHPGMMGQSPPQVSRGARARHDFGEIVIKNKPEADEVINQMFTILSQFGSVSVADLFEMTGIRAEHTDVRYGWTALPEAKAVRLRDGSGYVLDLPYPHPLGQ